MTPQEFSAKIKAKYPQYKDVDDLELAQKVVEKYPTYKSQVNLENGSTKPRNHQDFFSRVKDRFAGRAEKIIETTQDFANKPDANIKDVAQSGVNVAGQFAGGAIDIIGEGIKSILPKAAAEGLTKLSNKIADAVTENPRVLAGLNAVNDGIDKYSAWAEENPEDAKSLEAVVNIGSLFAGGRTKANISTTNVKDGVNRGRELLRSVAEKQKTKGALSAEEQAFKESLEITRPVLNKKESIAAFEKAGISSGGGVETKGALKTVRLVPDDRAIDIAESARGIVSKKSGPIDNIVNINKEIGRVSEAEVKPFLSQNPVPFNFEDLQRYLPLKVKPTPALKADTEAFATYRRVTDDILENIYRTLKKKANESGKFGNTTDFNDVWDARKVVDEVIERELGVATFDSPQYTGVRAASRDARNALSEFIVDSLSTPGQLDKINKMTDFLREARRRGIDLSTEKEAVSAIEKQFGITRTGEDMARAAFFKDKMRKLTNLYEARGNVAEANYRLLDKNALQRWIKQNPTKWKALKVGGGLVGLGSLGSLVGGD